jgi:hypothetical protein
MTIMMMKRHFLIAAAIVLLLCWLHVRTAWTQDSLLPLQHPREEGDLRRCSDCHEAEPDGFPFRRYEHTPLFGDNHRFTATGSQRVCDMCHHPSFCGDCHGAGAGLKPSVKNHTDTRRLAPHRGDYLIRHRIDGRLNPAKCFRCHGRPKAAKTCRPCHG